MAEPISIQQLKDASLDVKSLEEVVNEDENFVVTTRLGETYPSVKGFIKKLFENGGLPATPFATKALMTASVLVDGDYAMVTDDTVNNGLYIKTAGAWVKSEYDTTKIIDNRIKENLQYSLGDAGKFDFNTPANLNETAQVVTDAFINVNTLRVSSSSGAYFKYIPVNSGEIYVINNRYNPALLTVAFAKNPLTTSIGTTYLAANTTEYGDGFYLRVPDGVDFLLYNAKVSSLDIDSSDFRLVKSEPDTVSSLYGFKFSDDSYKDNLLVIDDLVTSGDLGAAERILPDYIDGMYLSTVESGYGTFKTSSSGSASVARASVKPSTAYLVKYDKPLSDIFLAFNQSDVLTTSNSLIRPLKHEVIDSKTIKVVTDETANFIAFTIWYSTEFDFREKGSVYIVEEANPNIPTITGIKGIEIEDKALRKLFEDSDFSNLKPKSSLEGKSWVVIGDSITYTGGDTNPKYHAQIKEVVGDLSTYIYGYSGRGFFNMDHIASTITQKYADYVTVFLGTNDWGNSTEANRKQLGEFLDEGTETTSGCINTMIINLLNEFPDSKIGFITPLPRGNNAWGENAEDNIYGFSLKDVNDLIIRYCNHYSIPHLDLYANSGMPPYINAVNSKYYNGDRLHPSVLGHTRLSNKIKTFLESL